MKAINSKAKVEEGITVSASTTSSSSASVCPYAAALNWNSDSDSVTTTATTNSSSNNNNNHPEFLSGIGNSMLRTNHDAITTSPSTTTKQMIQSCPAFQNGHCPFASCTNEQEIRKMLLQIPSSHYLNNKNNMNSKEKDEPLHHDDTEDVMKQEDDHPNTTNPADLLKPTTSTITTPFLKVLQDLHAVAGTIATSTTKTSTAIAIPKCPVFQMSSTTNTTTTTTTTTTTSSKFTHVIMDGYSLSEIMARLAKQIEEEEEDEGQEQDENEKGEASYSTTSVDATKSTTDAATKVLEDSNDAIATLMTGMTTEENPMISPLERNEVVPVIVPSEERQSTDKSDRKLSVTMKSGTAASHVAAENVYFVRNFIRGQIDPTLFAALTKQLYYVYRTLEHHLLSFHPEDDTDKNMVYVRQFYKYHEALQRTESLKEDLDYWFGTKEAESMIQFEITTLNDDVDDKFISPATMDYIRRIHYCAQHNPYLLLAHSYTRYLGDLSGGKILARVARKALQLSSTDGLAFYDFATTIPNTKQFKDEYRMALDQLNPPLNHEQIQLLVAEANIAFVLNMRIFEELDVMANIPDAVVRPYDEAIRPYVDLVSNNTSSHSNTTETPHQDGNHKTTKEIPKECPFAKMNTVSSTTTTINRSAVGQPSTLAAAATTTTTTYPNSSKAQLKRCPWPFIIFHDPKQALYDWQTWMVFGLVLCWFYHQFVLTAMPQ